MWIYNDKNYPINLGNHRVFKSCDNIELKNDQTGEIKLCAAIGFHDKPEYTDGWYWTFDTIAERDEVYNKLIVNLDRYI